MKKYFISLMCILVSVACTSAQSGKNISNAPAQDHNVVYRLYPTTNMWTFIKLDTRNGLMWQVQYTINAEDDLYPKTDNDYRFETRLNRIPLVDKTEEVNGRFILHPTQNIYNFILLDQLNGQTYQVQWSQKSENRFVIPIQQDR